MLPPATIGQIRIDLLPTVPLQQEQGGYLTYCLYHEFVGAQPQGSVWILGDFQPPSNLSLRRMRFLNTLEDATGYIGAHRCRAVIQPFLTSAAMYVTAQAPQWTLVLGQSHNLGQLLYDLLNTGQGTVTYEKGEVNFNSGSTWRFYYTTLTAQIAGQTSKSWLELSFFQQ